VGGEVTEREREREREKKRKRKCWHCWDVISKYHALCFLATSAVTVFPHVLATIGMNSGAAWIKIAEGVAASESLTDLKYGALLSVFDRLFL
jgi:hypothetical protein